MKEELKEKEIEKQQKSAATVKKRVLCEDKETKEPNKKQKQETKINKKGVVKAIEEETPPTCYVCGEFGADHEEWCQCVDVLHGFHATCTPSESAEDFTSCSNCE
ncbi:hypothetical protein JTB14_022177 [Gonioctena quinquepunctata]|nr:hypothetical protein JTB14_022177 [Gonioctena quinquepunctata]